MQGWIKLHRKLLENPIIKKPELLQIFLYCLLKANHEPEKILFNGEEMVIQRGQFVTGRNVLSNDLNQNGRTLYDRLKILKNLKIINIKTNNKFSLVTVVNYGLYQSTDGEANSNSNNEPTTSQQQANTNKNDKNDKEYIYGDFFESIWKLYPKKKGKGQISKSQKMKLYKIGFDELSRCIERYKKAIADTDEKFIQHGSTFFNSGYVDYLDKNYTEQKPEQQGRYKDMSNYEP